MFIETNASHKNNTNAALFSYKKGGVASGMRHTETNSYDVKRLLHVKGKKRVVAKEVSHVRRWWVRYVTGQGTSC